MSADAPVAAAGVGLAGYAYLVLAFGALPLAAWGTKRLLDRGEDLGPRTGLLLGLALQQALFAALTLLVAWSEEIPLFPPTWPRLQGWAAAVALLIAAAATIPVRWRRATPAERARLFRFAPAARGDLGPWTLVCVLAGFSEEIAWRGLLLALLERLGLPFEAAVGLSALSFALAHLAQGWGGAAPVFLFAIAFHLVVAMSGNLYAAIAAHTAYDVVAGLALLRYARRSAPPGPPPDDG